ncbi:hypothetical protein H5410_001972, partial [Solanum commersonii]
VHRFSWLNFKIDFRAGFQSDLRGCRRDTSADLLDYDKIVEEYTKNLGFVLVKQILVKGPSGKFYLLEGSEGIKTLQCLLNEQFKVVNLFVVDDFEETVFAPNIIHHSETYLVECEYGPDL